jgi:ADP-glucose pyrophosphorylase
MMMQDVLGLILGGGQGTRLYPLTKKTVQTGGAGGRYLSSH